MENKVKHENLINENESIFLGRLWKKYKDMQDEEEVCQKDLGNNSDTFWGWGHINISRMAFKDMIDELEENGLYTGMTLV